MFDEKLETSWPSNDEKGAVIRQLPVGERGRIEQTSGKTGQRFVTGTFKIIPHSKL